MLKLRRILLLLIAVAWIYAMQITIYKPITSLGKLFSFQQGIFFMSNPSDEINFSDSGYEAEISFDQYGVPDISGKTRNDVGFALGFMHARDRYFQMELITRTVRGSLSEILGEKTLDSDVFWKPLETEKRAKIELKQIKAKNPKAYSYLMAYNKGIRFYLKNEKQKERFPEYILIDEQPADWEDHYPILLSYYMSHMLAYSSADYSWAVNKSKLPDDLFQKLFSIADNYPYMYSSRFGNGKTGDLPISDLQGNSKERQISREELEKSQSIGSNAWVVSGSQSSENAALLCNDTHLNISMPNPWYQVQIRCDEFHLQGFTIPCNPFIVSGNNESIAWGITNAHWDEVDLFTLKMSQDKKHYVVDNKTKAFETKTNSVEIKGKAPFSFESKHCEFGIVREETDVVYAEKWHALDFNSSILAFDQLLTASNWNEFKTALKQFTFPAQNFVFSDKNGNIAMISAGILPLRDKKYQGEWLDGSVSYEFNYVDFDQLPQTEAVNKGFFSSANQLQAQTDYYINYNWTEPYRANRINQILSGGIALTIADMKKAQADKMDNSVKETMDVFGKINLGTKQSKFIAECSEWDGIQDASSKKPVKYFYLTHALRQNFDAYLSSSYDYQWSPSYQNILEFLKNPESKPGFNNQKFLSATVDTAMIWYSRYAGDHIVYGDVNPFFMEHILRIPGLGRFIPTKGGSTYTLDVNSSGTHGASMRTIIALSEKSPKIYTILAGGQSGRFTSRHYGDQVSPWNSGNYNVVDFQKTRKSAKANIKFSK